jgi:hypothetical protein
MIETDCSVTIRRARLCCGAVTSTDPVEVPFMIMGFNLRRDKRVEMPALVHVDGTVRPQTVSKEVNPAFWRMIKEFENRTGVPVLLNTSFNRHGQPMVHSPEDAALHVVWGCVEYLIIHKYLVDANVKLQEQMVTLTLRRTNPSTVVLEQVIGMGALFDRRLGAVDAPDTIIQCRRDSSRDG